MTSLPGRRNRDDDSVEVQQQMQSRREAYNAATSRANGCGMTLVEAIFAAKSKDNGEGGNNTTTAPQRFAGVLKEKYSDFIVRERNPHPLSLGDTAVRPECRDPPAPVIQITPLPSREKIMTALGELLSREDLDVLLPAVDAAVEILSRPPPAEATAEQQQQNEDGAGAARNNKNNNKNKNKNKNNNSGPAIAPVTLPTPRTDKLARAKIHQAIKDCGFPDSRTEGDGKISVQLAPAQQQQQQRNAAFNTFNKSNPTQVIRPGTCTVERSLWPAGRGEYLHFTLYKENVESGAALRQLAGRMGVPLKTLQYCGNKDKRAVTTQRVSGRWISAEALSKLNGMSFGRSCVVRFGDFEYRAAPLQLGKLLGNAFTIALRNVEPPEAADPEQLLVFETTVRQHGFANYFGPQRFGTTSIPSYEMGKALLRSDYKQTLLLAMRSKVEVCPDFANALDAFDKEGDIAKALKACPYHCTTERDVLIQLSQAPNDYLGAVLALPRPLTMLYCHSVQSLVWNTMVAMRLKAAPRVLVGDVVLAGVHQQQQQQQQNQAANQNNNNDDDDNQQNQTEGVQQQPDNNNDAGADAEDNITENEGPLPAVRFVTQDDIDSNRFSLSDVLLPIPGPDPELRFPQHTVSGRAQYEAVMAELGIGDALLNAAKFTEKRFHIHGAYRNMVIVPGNFSLRAVEYSSPDELLIETDYQRLLKQQQQQDSAAATAATCGNNSHDKKKYRAVIAEFELPAGAYATSVLREVCVTM